jgi:VCBS repeat-containing protein
MKRLLALAVTSVLAGCGGGGGDDSPPPPPPANRAPVLTTTALAATEDTALSAQIAATDADGNTLTFTRVDNVQHGTLTISAAGAVAYTPAANYAGADTFSVRVNDGAGGEATGTVTITVAAVNDAPAFTTLAFSVTEDTQLSGHVAPTDIDNNTLTVTRTGAPQHGQATVGPAGEFIYIPSANYFGADSFQVRVADGSGGETPATVTVTITPVNDTPVLVTNAVTVNEDSVLSVQLVGADAENQPLTFALDDVTTHGQVSVSSSGLLSYTPNPNYFGADTLSVTISEGPQAGSSWPVAITVNSVNDAPVATDDEFRIAASAPKTMVVTGNDSDTEAGAMTVSIAQQPAGGIVSVGANNLLTFTPANNFTGPVTFTYRLTDSDGGYDDATVRALIGDFQGLVYLADEFVPGRPEIYLFDGLITQRLVENPGNDFEVITRFALSGDGSKLLYVVAGPMVDNIYFKPINAPGAGTRIFTNTPSVPNPSSGAVIALNRSGSFAIIEDRYSSAAKRVHVVNTSTPATGPNTPTASLLGGDESQVIRASIVVFNTQDDNQVAVQGQIGGTVPTTGTEYYSAFVADAANPRELTQIGSDYPQVLGRGDGFGFWFGGSGRYIYHTEYQPAATPVTKTLLMYDNDTQTGTVVYRRPAGSEHGLTVLPNTNADGSHIVFGFTEPSPTNGDGPAAFYMSGHADPAVATPLSTPYFRAGYIYPAATPDTMIIQAQSLSTSPMYYYARSLISHVVGPMQIGKSLDPGEEFSRAYRARRTNTMVIGYRTPPSLESRMYVVPVWGSTSPLVPFTSTFPYTGAAGEDIDDYAQHLAYAPIDGSRRLLRVMSTRATDYSFPVMGTASTGGVTQFRWLPQP